MNDCKAFFFYEVSVKESIVGDRGRPKQVARKLLVQARSFGHAEELVSGAHPVCEITSIRKSKVQEVIASSQLSASENGEEQTPQLSGDSEKTAGTVLTPLSRAQRRALEREAAKRRRKEAWREAAKGLDAKNYVPIAVEPTSGRINLKE